MLNPGFEQNLIAHTDSEQWSPQGHPLPDHVDAPDPGQPRHAGREGADAGHNQPIGCQGSFRIGGQLNGCTGPGQRPKSRAKVAGAVVQDDDPRHRAPLVLGTPVARASGSIAPRRARARALI